MTLVLDPTIAAPGAERLLSDPDLRAAFGASEDVAALAARLGVAAPILRPPPLELDTPPPPGWLPAAIEGGRVDWTWFGRRALDEGFYFHDAQAARRLAINRLLAITTPLSALPDAGTRAPDGLVFHLSRCGSTLMARMLAADPDATVISEGQPIEAAVRSGDPRRLRAVVAAFARPRGAGEARLFLKLDCWHTRDMALFRAAFPETPWVFVHREPVEVMVSHARQPGIQMVPSLVDPAILGIEAGNPLDPAYHAAVLASVCEGALEAHAGGGGLMIDYRQLPEALFTRVLPHFGVAVSSDIEARMRVVANLDAKSPGAAFTPDGAAKRRAADSVILAACEGRLAAAHARLRRLSEIVVP